MDTDILRSYFVDLGFAVNHSQLRKFDDALRQAGNSVSSRTGGIVIDVLKWQTAISGAFLGVSAGIVGMAEHVAMADQRYRLLGLRMMMSTEAARKLQIGMDSLGASLEEISWDPELNRNFLQIAELQDRLTQNLGPNVEKNLRGIRDIIQQFHLLSIEGKYLSMQIISSVFEKMGSSVDGVHAKLQELIEWIADPKNFDTLQEWFASKFVPILKTSWDISKQIGTDLGIAATMFTNLVAWFSGDKSIEGTEFSFDKLGKAIEHCIDWVGDLLHLLEHAEQILLHFANAAFAAFNRDWKGAAKELKAGLDMLSPGTGAVLGGVAGAGVGGTVGAAIGGTVGATVGSVVPVVGTAIGGAVGASMGGGAGTLIGGGVGAGTGAIIGKDPKTAFGMVADILSGNTAKFAADLAAWNAAKPREDQSDKPQASHESLWSWLSRSFNVDGDVAKEITERAKSMNVDAALAKAIAQRESSMRQFDEHGNPLKNHDANSTATGLFQLTNDTAHGLGVNSSDLHENIAGGVKLLAQLLQHYGGNQDRAAAAYYWGSGNLDNAIARHQALPPEVLQYVQGVRANEGQQVTIGDVQVNILQPGASKEDVHQAVTGALADAAAKQSKQSQRNMAQLANAG